MRVTSAYVCVMLTVNALSTNVHPRQDKPGYAAVTTPKSEWPKTESVSHSCDMSVSLSRAILCVIGFIPVPRQRERQW